MRRKILWIAAILLLVILLSVLLLHTPFVKAKVLHYIQKQLAQTYNLSLSAQSLDYNLLTLRVSLKKFNLKSLDNPAHPPFFQADLAVVQLTMALIFKKKIDLAAFYLEKPVINVHIYPDKSVNIPAQLFKKSEEPTPQLIFRHIIVNNASLFFHDQTKNLQASLQRFHLEGALPEKGKKELILQLPSPPAGTAGSIIFKDNTVRFEQVKIITRPDEQTALVSLAGTYLNVNEPFTFTGQVHWEQNRLSVPGFRFTLREGEISGQGVYYSTPGPTPSHLSLNWKNLNLQSPLLTKFFSHPFYSAASGSGDLAFRELSLNSIQANIAAAFQPLKTPLPHGFIHLTGQASLRLDSGKITIPSSDLFAQGDNIQGKLAVKNDTFQAELNGVLYHKPSISGHLKLSGRLNADPANPTATAQLESNGLRIGDIIEVVPKGTVKYEHGRLIIAELLIRTKDAVPAQLTLSGTIPLKTVPPGSPNPLDMTVNARDIPAARLLSFINKNYRAQGTISLDGRILPKLYRANVRIASLKIDRSSLNTSDSPTEQWLDLGDILGQFELIENHLTYRIQAPDLFTEITGSGRTTSPYPLAGALTIDIPNLEKLSARLGFTFLQHVAGHIQGQVNFQLDLGSGLKNLQADAVINKLSLHSRGQDLENLEPVHFSFSPAGISIHKLELQGLGSQISGNGFLPGGSFEKPPPGPPQNFLLEKNSPGLHFLAQIDPALLNLFVPSLQFKGLLTLRANISGSLGQPFLAAELTVKEFSIEKPPVYPVTPTTPAQTGFRGLLDGYIRTSGNVRSPGEFTAEAQFPVLELYLPGLTVLRAPEPVKLRLENGQLHIQQMSLRDESDWSVFTIAGTAGLTGTQPLDFTVTGQVDARLAGLFLEDFQFNGKNDLSLRIKGNLQKPEISGSLDMHDFELSLPEEKVYMSRVNGKMLFLDDRIVVGPLTGKLNDGSLNVSGEIIIDTKGVQKLDITLNTTKSHFEWPKGLFSEVSSRLNFSYNGIDYLLAGTVEIDEGVYKEPFNILNKVLDYLRGSPVREAVEEGTFSDLLNLDIEVHTISPVFIDTNLSRSEITAGITVRGTLARPTLGGRVMIKEGGEIYIGKNRFVVENGLINFVNLYRIDPELNIRARGKVNNYDILLSITGTLSALSINVSSTPPLPQPNIIGLLMGQSGGVGDGGVKENTSSSFLAYAGSRAMGYLGSALSGSVEKLVRGTLGIESFRLDGSLIASKDNPGARVTVGQRLTPKLELILSQSLTQAQNRTWILDYKPLPNFSVEARKQDKENYTASVLGELLFGRKTRTEKILTAKRTKPVTISNIEIQGDIGLPISTIRKSLKLRKGKKFNFFKFRDDLDRLHKLYLKHDFLRADIDSERIEENGKVTIRYTINAGPRIYLDFYGTDLPGSFKKKACSLWCDARFDMQATRYVVREIYLQLYKKGYYQAQVTMGTPVEGNNIIRYPFNIETGIKYDSVQFLFPANTQVPGRALNRFLKKMKLHTLTFYDPVQVVDELIQYYKERGFLEVRIKPPEIRYFPGLKKTKVTFIITEGPQARIGQITFNGNRFLKSDVLLKTLSLKKNDVFSPVKLNEVSYEISDAYAQKGFNQIRVTYTKQYVSGIGVMNLLFNIEENQRGVIREIIITGNSLTRTSIIQRELTFKQGDTLDFHQVNKSRMKLYGLEIFQWIDIDAQPMAEETPGSEKPFRVVIEVNEIRPYRVKGGLQWDTDKKLGAVMEFSSPNTFGKAHYLGTSFIIDQKENGFKAYYRFPYFFKKKIATEFFAFAGKKVELNYTINRKGFMLQQQYRYREMLLFSFSYSWERDHVTRPGSLVETELISTVIPALDIKFNLGYLTAALTYDRRNNIVNPTRGFFLSGSGLYARKFLGSQVNFYRFYGEGQLYLPVSGFLVIASSLRAGSGRGLGQEYLPGERFLAGGGNTLRGFKESMVGPLDINGKPTGGEALFIFNQELRIRLSDMFIFVLFADVGNVYGAAREFDIFNVRKSAGFGVRVYAGPLLLRADLGFILNRRQGEPSSRLILSIGQAF